MVKSSATTVPVNPVVTSISAPVVSPNPTVLGTPTSLSATTTPVAVGITLYFFDTEPATPTLLGQGVTNSSGTATGSWTPSAVENSPPASIIASNNNPPS